MCPTARSTADTLSFQLEDEPPLKYKRMMAMDGNNSLKNMAPRKGGDHRVFDSDYYLTPTYVNQYANEVKSRSGDHVDQPSTAQLIPHPAAAATATHTSPAPDPPDPPNADVSPEVPNTDVDLDVPEPDAADASPPSKCTEKWKAASADSKKKMWSIFLNAGIFASACRHGQILWIIDMIASGEL